MNKIIALVGMPGAGKTETSQHFIKKGYLCLRFGQAVLDEAMARGTVNETAEKEIRNGFRKKFGMGAMAILNLNRIVEMLKKGNVVIEDLYSWDEYKILKDKFGMRFAVVALVASPKTRHARLIKRKYDPKKDKKALFRPLTPAEAQSRDYDQIENAAQGGPIAMADFYLLNEGTKVNLKRSLMN